MSHPFAFMMNALASLDLNIVYALSSIRTPVGVSMFSLITDLGGAVVVIPVALFVCAMLWYRKELPYAIGLIAAVLGGEVVKDSIKELVMRARPPVELHAIVEDGWSFPSGHATAALALYGFLIYATWKFSPASWRMPLTILFSAIILFVGFSRLYLGVHYTSDVVAGFALGALFLWFGVLIGKRLSGSGGARG